MTDGRHGDGDPQHTCADLGGSGGPYSLEPGTVHRRQAHLVSAERTLDRQK